MAGLSVHNLLSAATGIALAMAVARAFARSSAVTVGNFRVDLTRAILYVLQPLSVVLALVFVVLGVPQTLAGSFDAATLAGAHRVGGGLFNANAAHPFENPSTLSNVLAIRAMLALSAALPMTFGRMVRAERQDRAILRAMAVLLTALGCKSGAGQHEVGMRSALARPCRRWSLPCCRCLWRA